jgi:hypothetical protein
MIARHKRPADRFTYQWEQRALEQDASFLKKLGFTGFSYMDKGERVFSTWDERLAIVNEKLSVLTANYRPEARK